MINVVGPKIVIPTLIADLILSATLATQSNLIGTVYRHMQQEMNMHTNCVLAACLPLQAVSMLCSGEKEEREVNVGEVEKGNSTISDRGWKVARSGQGGESMQGLPVSRVGRRLPLADTGPAWDHLRQPLMTEVNRCDDLRSRVIVNRLPLYCLYHALILVF